MKREVAVAKLQGLDVKLYDAKGGYMRTLSGNGAVSVDVSGGTVAVHFKNGQVKLYNSEGNYVRTL